MNKVVCIVPVVPVRQVPDHRAEMSSQLLFGSIAEVLERDEYGWLYIRNSWDGYLGWCRENQFIQCNANIELTTEYTGDWVDEIYINEQKLMIPFGSNLAILKNSLPGIKAEFNGNIYDASKQLLTAESLLEVGSIYLNTAYLWGGMSVFGIDCSGFVQSVFRMFNIPMLRDARDQVSQGSVITGLTDARWGDLAFFAEEGSITHVGILLDSSRIIHASGNVRIDTIDEEGILHSGSGKRTHRLEVIKRIVNPG